MNDIKMRVGKEYYPKFTPYINFISPQFVKIYEETILAENQELFSIIGISYGKSLEFLIRDYAIAQTPTEKEKILKVRLVEVINNYIKDNSIKNSTDIARWHPTGTEAEKLNKIEEDIEKILKQSQTVHFVARIIRNGFRDLLYYIDQPKLKQSDVNAFCDNIMKERGINFTMQEDPTWKAVGFIK